MRHLQGDGLDNITMTETNGVSAEELYRRYRGGDEQAFEELVGLYRESLTRYIRRFVSDAREAEELMIDAFAELSVDTKFKGQSSIKTYLFSIGRNIALKHIKRIRLGGHLPVEYAAEETEYHNNLPEMDFIREEQRGQVREAMRRLRQEYREVLHLIYFEDMSYDDAGKTMRKTAVQVDHLLRRAKASLKSVLEDGGL
jgi:RNA polymerase sigma-70 factor (ECF subfamily)